MGVRPVGSVGGNWGPLGALQHPWVLIGVGYRNPESCLGAWAVLQPPWVLIGVAFGILRGCQVLSWCTGAPMGADWGQI